MKKILIPVMLLCFLPLVLSAQDALDITKLDEAMRITYYRIMEYLGDVRADIKALGLFYQMLTAGVEDLSQAPYPELKEKYETLDAKARNVTELESSYRSLRERYIQITKGLQVVNAGDSQYDEINSLLADLDTTSQELEKRVNELQKEAEVFNGFIDSNEIEIQAYSVPLLQRSVDLAAKEIGPAMNQLIKQIEALEGVYEQVTKDVKDTSKYPYPEMKQKDKQLAASRKMTEQMLDELILLGTQLRTLGAGKDFIRKGDPEWDKIKMIEYELNKKDGQLQAGLLKMDRLLAEYAVLILVHKLKK